MEAIATRFIETAATAIPVMEREATTIEVIGIGATGLDIDCEDNGRGDNDGIHRYRGNSYTRYSDGSNHDASHRDSGNSNRQIKKKGKDIGDSDGLHRENGKCYESRRDRGNGEGIHRDSVITNRQ